jgi:phosphoglucosamine mutase
MTRYPQVMVNVEVAAEGKLRFYTDNEVKEAIEAAKKKLGNAGRVVVRPSGTEPLLRVMIEGEDPSYIEALANSVADVIRERLS